MTDATDLGKWMLCFASLVALCYYGRMLWVSFIPKNGYVTQAQIKEFQEYVRTNLHEIKNDMQRLLVAVAVLEEKQKR